MDVFRKSAGYGCPDAFVLVAALTALTLCLGVTTPTFAAERDADAAQQAALGHSPDMQKPARPAKMPDLTRGEPLPPPGKDGPVTWNMGPAGIVGIKNGGNSGDQVQVISIVPGSPAEGLVLPGDVLLGVAGRDFAVGGDMNRIVGSAIIKAEEEAGKGLLRIHIWRDRNWTKRASAKDVFGVDLDTMFEDAESDGDIYEWQGEEERTVSVKQMSYDEFPIDGVKMDVELQLNVMGTYSETSPWDCPVVEKVRENAWKRIAAGFRPDRRGRVRGSWPSVLALVASAKPEYVALARQWVHSLKLIQDMEAKVSLADVSYRGMQSWANGFDSLEMAIYHEATGDNFVLPEIRKRAIIVALGQNGGGSWGHTFSFPDWNGGMLHRNNPGYGAMNNAGTRCFFLLSLAKEAGIEHPEIDAAIARASRFFGTFVDKGCIPYGYHPPWASDDSNGKNYGAAYAFYVLGRKYEAKFFSMHSAHASFTRRGGHGSPTLWYYTPLSANIAGPKGVMASMRNMRYFYTLSRRHDGSFVFLGEQAPGIGGKGMRNPTATVAMHLSVPLKQLVITGKGADENFWMTDEEYEELLVSARGTSARGQIKDPRLLKQTGKPWPERGTDELIDMLDHFYPNMRRSLAKELSERFAAGQEDILAKLLPLLDSEEARMRDGACRALSACGADTVLASLSKIRPLLDDSAEFVRMTAISTIAKATEPGDENREVAMLLAAADEYMSMTMDNGNVRTAVRDAIFPGGRKGSGSTGSKLSTMPFEAGYDPDLVRSALERLVIMDPGGTVPREWTEDTLLRLAGPITFVADEMQLNDAMFGFARTAQGRALLSKYGYREAIEGDVTNLLKRHELERDMRRRVRFKMPYITPRAVKKAPGLYREVMDQLYLWLQDSPTAVISESNGKGNPPTLTPLDELVDMIEKDSAAQRQPSIGPAVERMLAAELARVDGAGAKLKLCRAELSDPARKNYFRQMAAMTQLAGLLGPDAINDIVPYLGHEHWRVRDHAHRVAVELAGSGAADRLMELFPASKGLTASGMLAVLGAAGERMALKPAQLALKHADPVVREAAVQAVVDLGGPSQLKQVLAFLKQTDEPPDLHGCELALLSRRSDAAFAKRVSEAAIAMLPKASPRQRRSLAWVLGQLGGPENLAVLQKAAATTEDAADLEGLMLALAYSPDRAADATMLELAKVDRTRLDAVAAASVHRMVGRNGPGDVTDKQRLDFAAPLLRRTHDKRLITYLGKVHTGRSARVLLEVMKDGSTETAAESIIACAEGMENPAAADASGAADALTEVIEYIEVTRLRGGLSAHMRKEDQYAMWKTMQARAGKALLKVHKPEKAPIPEFDDMDLDL